MDFDVHHGNGTEEISRKRDELYYLSTHQHPLFPGTGGPAEVTLPGIVNVSLAEGDGSEAFRQAFTDTVLSQLDAMQPELILISAGFDAHRADPLATLQLDETDFAWATRELVALARRHCQGRVVSVLEGGYNTSMVGRCASAHLEAMMM